MSIPNLTSQDVEFIMPGCTVIGNSLRGGQKIVYPCKFNDEKLAVKFIMLAENIKSMDNEVIEALKGTLARAKREILTMKEINSPYVVKLASLEPRIRIYNNQLLLFYAEEWIDGYSLEDILYRKGKLPYKQVAKMCLDITKAIDKIWSVHKIHRDIKPANISRRNSTGDYVLLDFGVAFDLEDVSITKVNSVVGTYKFFSPEQLDLSYKRSMDFRSDIFSLGIVAYIALSGKHPFCDNNTTYQDVICNIARKPIIPLNILDSSIPKQISDIVSRMLHKNANGRYRKCSLLIRDLEEILEKE